MTAEGAPEIKNKLAAIRKQRGVPASALARTVGVSRQTIYALEAGTYVPNTALALRLARALGVSVEDLFSLAEDSSEPAIRSEKVKLLPAGEELFPGQPVQLCEVNGKLVAAASSPASCYLPASDGYISGVPGSGGKASVQLHEPESDFGNRILISGCDPAASLIKRDLEPAGVQLVLLHQNSSKSLSLLKNGSVHIAGTHLRDDASGESNKSAVKKLFPGNSVAVISLAVWQEGLVIAQGNPRQISGVQDLERRDVTFINREPGSGSRALLDSQLKRLNLESKSVDGYRRTAPGHLAAAWAVKTGGADCCVATQSAARAFGLHFIPLQSARYDLVLRKQHLNLRGIQILMDTINRLSFRRKLKTVAGYDTTLTGGRICF